MLVGLFVLFLAVFLLVAALLVVAGDRVLGMVFFVPGCLFVSAGFKLFVFVVLAQGRFLQKNL